MNSILAGIKNVLLWSYERGTWQYDLLCLLIISVVFLLPGRFFGDRDRVVVKPIRANQTSFSASKPGETVREITVSDLQDFLQRQNRPEMMLNEPKQAIVLYLRDQLKQNVVVTDIEPYMNPQGRVGYRVWIQ
ncbi:MAG: hypothetical protein M3X11_06350 [Acidobacteriota bacterium]|nr:hypothetical protein [Acidobacteriota bacterium]